MCEIQDLGGRQVDYEGALTRALVCAEPRDDNIGIYARVGIGKEVQEPQANFKLYAVHATLDIR